MLKVWNARLGALAGTCDPSVEGRGSGVGQPWLDTTTTKDSKHCKGIEDVKDI